MVVDFSADLAFCRWPRIWPVARAEGRVTVPLNDLFSTGDGSTEADAVERKLLKRLRDAAAASVKFGDEALRTYALAITAENEDRTGDALDDVIRDRLAEVLLHLVPVGTIREWLDLGLLKHGFTEDGRGLLFRVPIRGVGTAEVCVVARLDAKRPTIPEGCHELGNVNRSFWETQKRRVEREFVARLWGEAEEALKPFVKAVPALDKVLEVLAERGEITDPDRAIRATVSTERAVLEFRMPAAVEALELVPRPPVESQDLAGRLRLAVDFGTEAVTVDAIPEVDFASVAERFYGALGGEPPALYVTTVSADETDVCNGRPGLRLAFDRRWPVEGEIGSLCWTQEHSRFDFVAPAGNSVDITIAAADLKLVVNRSDIRRADDGDSLRILGTVSVAGVEDPWGLRESALEMLIELDLTTGELTVPAEPEQNEDFYRHIRRRARAMAMLPPGAWIERVEFSTNGIDPTIRELLGSDGIEGLPDLPAPSDAECHIKQAVLVGRMLRDLELPSEEEQKENLCSGDQKLAEHGELRLHADGPTVLTWRCLRSASGPGLRRCTVTSAELGRVCRVELVRSSGSGTRTRMPNAGDCLADALGPFIPVQLSEFSIIAPDVSFSCPDPVSLRTCWVDVTAHLRLDGILAQLPEQTIEVAFRLNLDGGLRPVSDVLPRLQNIALEIGERLKESVEREWLDAVRERVEREWLDAVRERVKSALGTSSHTSFDCRAVLRAPYEDSWEVPCDYYGADITEHAGLLVMPPRALIFGRAIQLFERKIHIEFILAFGADHAFLEPSLRVRCASCDDRLDELADEIADVVAGMPGGPLRYNGGATLHTVEDELRLRMPFEMELPFVDASFPVVVTCSLDAREGDVFCEGQPRVLLSAAVVEAIKNGIEERGGRIAIPFGPFVAAVTDADRADTRIELRGEVSFPGVDAVELTVTLPLFGHRLRVEWDWDQLSGDMKQALVERINGLFGSAVPVEVIAVELEDDNGWPTGVRISGAASVAKLFTISVPDVLLTDEGLAIDGPRELTIGFPAGLQLPVPPFTVCPSGGSLGPARLVVMATVTVAECSAGALLDLRGRGEVRLDTPGVFRVRGNLRLLGFLSLGSATAELNLPGRFLETQLDMGGAIADVVRFRSDMRVDGGDAPSGRARGALYLFTVPLSEQSVYVDLARGGVEAEVRFDVFGVIVAQGNFAMETFGRNPRLAARGSARILGFSLGSLGLDARPNYAKAGFTVLGLGLSVVVPGLDALSPSTLIDIIKNLLTPNFENLDEALLALLKGQITLNPLADFGAGGQSALDGGDGAGEESPVDEGLGADDGEPEPPAGGPEPPAGGPESGPGEPTLLNPPGRFHVSIGKDKDDEAWAVDLMEGNKHDTTIARVPGHPLTLPALRDGAGRALAFTRMAYAHLADGRMAEDSAVAGCPAKGQVVPTVLTFSGVETPRVGFFELCRLKTNEGLAMTPESLSDTANGDLLRPFLTGLAAFPGSMPRLSATGTGSVSEAPSRVLLSGWMGEIGDGTRIVAGLAAPGRLLLVAEMRGAPDGARCTVTVMPEQRAGLSIRAFVVNAPNYSVPLDSAEVAKLGHVLGGLAACSGESATLASVGDVEYLSAEGYLSRWDAEADRFVLVREPEPEDLPVAAPPAPMALAVRQALRAETPPAELIGSAPPPLGELAELAERAGTGQIAVLNGGSGDSWIEFTTAADDACVVRYGGASEGTITGFPARFFNGDCEPDAAVVAGHAVDTADDANPGRVLVLEIEQDRETANLVHLGWGMAQRVELGSGWRTAPAFLVYRAAFQETLGATPLELQRATVANAAAWLDFVPVHPADGRADRRVIWANRIGYGRLQVPDRLSSEQVDDLPRLMGVLATDPTLPHPGEYEMVEALVAGSNNLVLRTRNEDASAPVVTWSATDTDLPPGWQLSARLIERPVPQQPTARRAARALLDRRLRRLTEEPSALITRDVWMFQYGGTTGVAFRGEAGPDEILWRYEDTGKLITIPEAHIDAIQLLSFDLQRNLICLAMNDYFALVEEENAQAEWRREVYTDDMLVAVFVAARNQLGSIKCPSSPVWDVPLERIQEGLAGPESAVFEKVDQLIEHRGGEARIGTGTVLEGDFATGSARLDGFFALHRFSACDAPASVLLDRFDAESLDDWKDWAVWSEPTGCRTGDVFFVERAGDGDDADSIRKIERFRDGAFELVSDIDGDPLPRDLFAAFRAEFIEEVDEPLHLDGTLVSLDHLRLSLAPAWAAAMPGSNELVVLLMAGGDARRVIIHGVSDESDDADALGNLISFAVASPGEEFTMRSLSNGRLMVEVSTTSGDRWLVVFNRDFAPTHWVGVDGASMSGDLRRDTLALVLEAASQVDDQAFHYGDGRRTPPRWDVAADDAALAIRPIAGGPYLLFGPVGEAEDWGMTVLCAPPLSKPLQLDLARQAGSHFGSPVPNTRDLVAKLKDGVCSGPAAGVARFQPASDREDEGLLTSIDRDGRLVVATFTSCRNGEDPVGCTLHPQRSKPQVPSALARRLLARVRAEVGTGARVIGFVHDDGPNRRLLFAWEQENSNNLWFHVEQQLLFDMERNPGSEICALASGVKLRRGRDDAPTLQSRDVVEALLAYFEKRGCGGAARELFVLRYDGEVVVFEKDGGLRAAAVEQARWAGREVTEAAARYASTGALNGERLVTTRTASHAEAGVSQFPRRPVGSAVGARGELRDHLRSLEGRDWPLSVAFAEAQTRTARSDGSGRDSVFIQDREPAAVSVPFGLPDEERWRIYDAMIPYLMRTTRQMLEVVRAGDGENLYRSDYDDGLTLVVDTARTVPRTALLMMSDSTEKELSAWVLRAAAEPRSEGADELSPALDLVGGGDRWLVAERPEGWVRGLARRDTQLLGRLPALDSVRRKAMLNRVAVALKPFCAFDIPERAWLHFKHGEVDCEELVTDGARRRWLVWSLGRWIEIETALELRRVPIDTAIGILPAMSGPDAVFVQVTDHGGRHLLALMAPSQGAPRERCARLKALYRLRGTSEPARVPFWDDGDSAACLPRSDFDVLLDDLAGEDPPGELHLLALDVAGSHDKGGRLLPVLYGGAGTTVSRLGFSGQLIDLHLVDLGSPSDAPEAAVVGAETPTEKDVSPRWRDAYLAFAAADPAELVTEASNASPVLAIPPPEGETRGWLIVSQQKTVEISRNLEHGPDRAEARLEVPSEALSAMEKRRLVARLVAELHRRLGPPSEKWPDRMAATGQPPFLAELRTSHRKAEEISAIAEVVALDPGPEDLGPEAAMDPKHREWIVAAEEISAIVEVVALDPGPEDLGPEAAMDPDGWLRGGLRKGFKHWRGELPARWVVHRVPPREAAVFGWAPGSDRPLSAAGYWSGGEFEEIVGAGNVAIGRAEDVAAAVREVTEDVAAAVREVTEGALPTLLRLDGNHASLRLCSDLKTSFRVIQMRDPGHQFNLDIWQDGKQLICAENRGRSGYLDAVIPGISSPETGARVALVLSSEGDRTLVARSSEDRMMLARFHEDEEVSTGCRSNLKGVGAAVLVQTLMEKPDLHCADAMEYKGGAAIAGSEGTLVLARVLERERCTLELKPHETSELGAEDARKHLEAYYDHASSNLCRDGDGSWLVKGNARFAIANSQLWQVETSREVGLTGGVESRHEGWMAGWMASPGIFANDEQQVVLEARTVGEYLAIIKEGYWNNATRPGRASIVVLGSSTCLATRVVPGVLDESAAGGLQKLDRRRQAGVSALAREESLPEFAEGGPSSAGDWAYVCDVALVDLEVGEIPRVGVAQLTMGSKCSLPWLTLPWLKRFPDGLAECIQEIDFWAAEDPTESLLVKRGGGAEVDLEKRKSFLFDLLRDNEDETARSASDLLANLGGGWEIESWGDKYNYLLVNDASNDTQRFRTNVIGGVCREIEDDENLGVLFTNNGFTRTEETCGSDSNGLCALRALYQKVSSETGDDLPPLWYQGLFKDDPRRAIWLSSIECGAGD